MGVKILLVISAGTVCFLGTPLPGSDNSSLVQKGPFTNVPSILAISREDQTKFLKTKMIRKEVTLSDAIHVLTTYRQVSRDDYLQFAHQIGVPGTVTTKEHGVCLWSIEPGYAAVVTLNGGGKIYLLAR